MRNLTLVLIGVLGIAIISKIINKVFRFIGFALLIFILWQTYNSGFLTQDVVKDMITPPSYNTQTQEFTFEVSDYIVKGVVGNKKVDILKDGVLIKTLELPTPIKVKNNDVQITKDIVKFILKNIDIKSQELSSIRDLSYVAAF